MEAPVREGLAFAGICVLVAVLWFIFRRTPVGSRFLARFLWIDTAANFVIIPMTLFGLGRLSTRVFDAFDLPAWAEGSIVATQFALYIAVAIGFGRVVELWITVAHADEDHDGHLPQLLRLLLYGASLIGGLAVFLSVNGYRPTELYLSTGVLEDGTEGGVVDINWRTTRLRQWDNATLVVPNGVLAKTRIRNLHDRHHMYSPWYTVRISADYDPRAIKVLLLEAALRCRRTVPGELPTIRLSEASQSPYTYMVWVHFPNYLAMFAGREELFRENAVAQIDRAQND